MFENDKSLTVVLPVHNAETRLRRNVNDLLELASELTAKFGVLIIDDGSTDSTFEVAEELAAAYPQVSVRRHRQCRGLGAAFDYAKRCVRTDAVIVHDGVTPINPHEMRGLWQRWLVESGSSTTAREATANRCEFGNLPALQTAMERVHRQVVGFQLMTPVSDNGARCLETPSAESPRRHSSHTQRRAGLGGIPALPRPKFLSALAAFALGE